MMSVLSTPSPHMKKAKRRKGMKEENDELLDLAMKTASEGAVGLAHRTEGALALRR